MKNVTVNHASPMGTVVNSVTYPGDAVLIDVSTGDAAATAAAAATNAHEGLTNNPHSVTFTQAVTADTGTNISAAEAETLTNGSNADLLHTHDTDLLRDPVTDFYDPTAGLPVGPTVGDRYISDATANGWTIDHIYEWDGDSWIEEEPDEGWMLWVIVEFMFYFFFSGGWVDANSKVAVDSAATPGYLGAASDDGVLRTNSQLSCTDGGNFITLGLAGTDITGAELETLTDTSNADSLHVHAHSATTGKTANDHHNESHTIASHSDAPQAHIIDADGSLLDITTKFNTLLSQLETLGLLASS